MTNLIRWEPFRDLISLREAMDRLFQESFIQPRGNWTTPSTAQALAVDMYETSEEVVVTTALPGVEAEDVDVSVAGDTLTIKAKSSTEEEVQEANYIRRERHFGSFARSLPLPTNVVADKAVAEFSKGVLTLRLPKAEAVKPKQIKIKTK